MQRPLPPAHFATKRAASQGTSFPLEIEYRELQRVNQDKTEGHECQSAKQRSQRRTTRGGPPPCKTHSLTLRSSRRSRAAIRARKRSLTAVLARCIASLVNLDRALEISSVLDRNPRRGQIPHHRPVLLDLNSIARAQIALYVSVNHHLARNHIRCDLGASSHRQLAILQLTNPSTVPSISKSSFPVISPFTCRLEPSRAVLPELVFGYVGSFGAIVFTSPGKAGAFALGTLALTCCAC